MIVFKKEEDPQSALRKTSVPDILAFFLWFDPAANVAYNLGCYLVSRGAVIADVVQDVITRSREYDKQIRQVIGLQSVQELVTNLRIYLINTAVQTTIPLTHTCRITSQSASTFLLFYPREDLMLDAPPGYE